MRGRDIEDCVPLAGKLLAAGGYQGEWSPLRTTWSSTGSFTRGPHSLQTQFNLPTPFIPFFSILHKHTLPYAHIFTHTHMFLPGCPRSTAFHFPSKQEAIVPKFGPLSITFHILLCFRLTIYPSFFHQKIMSLVIFR